MAKRKESHVGYWLGDRGYDYDLSDRGGSDLSDVLTLAAIKRSIANFVQIVTKKSIPVKFSSGQQSYTEGKTVTISASTKQKSFDAVVGLALHEASHILLTDFDFIKAFKMYSAYMVPQSLFDAAEAKFGYTGSNIQVVEWLDLIMNIIDDRRIDHYMYRTAPGYRPYYEAMYDTYFRDREIDKALQQGRYAKPTVANYMFYLTNLTHPLCDTRHLPDLDLIFGIVDLPNIQRLNDDAEDMAYVKRLVEANRTDFEFDKLPEIFRMSVKILEIIVEHSSATSRQAAPQRPSMTMPEDESKEKNLDTSRQSGGGQTVSVSGGSSSDDSDGDADGNDDADSDDEKNEGSDSGKDEKGGSGSGDDDTEGEENASGGSGDDDTEGEEKESRVTKKASEDAKKKTNEREIDSKRLGKALKKQKNFLKGNVSKKNITDADDKAVNTMDQSSASMVDVDHETQYGGRTKTRVLVLRDLTKEILQSGSYPFTPSARSRYCKTSDLIEEPHSVRAVANGLRAGSILAHRLSIRNQNKVTEYNRREQGKLDKRRLHALGFNDTSVFNILKVAEFDPVHVHLTIDASSSMSGVAWQKALTVGIALAVAASKIQNLNVTISIRAGTSGYATISVIYDSTKDKVVKIKQLFPYLTTCGTTPEGLTFQAYMDDLLGAARESQKYFVNLSDGEPYYDTYSGPSAWKHTRTQVNRLRSEGIKVLSYFVSNNRTRGRSREAFHTMYGKDASYIDTEQITSLIATLNKKFLER
jgi:hypothetical protein